MNICVYGLWHLGSVTAAGLSEIGFDTVGLDDDIAVVERLLHGRAPLYEPGLDEMISRHVEGGRLRFETNYAKGLANCDIVWVAFDTPVDDDDRADTDAVCRSVVRLFPHLREGMVVLISSQMPVGSTAALESRYREAFPDVNVEFAYSPENLRLGQAIKCFLQADRIVVGVRSEHGKSLLQPVFDRICDQILYVGVESAEMTKHALNAFLATSITFINEIASVCENVGADAGEVEQTLKSDIRIGKRAYLHAGNAFAGGTLARDVSFLTKIGEKNALPLAMLSSVLPSNRNHRQWWMRQLKSRFGKLEGRVITVLGLTYKPGTDTLRRSTAIELCRWISDNGGQVRAFDPVVKTLPEDLAAIVDLKGSVAGALKGSDALIVATQWPEFEEIAAHTVCKEMNSPMVIDQNRFLNKLSEDANIIYVALGKAS